MGRTEERVKEEHHVKKWISKWTVATALLVVGRTPKVALLVLGLTPGAALANDGYPRMDDVDILHYRIQLEIGETGRTIQGETTILAEMLAGGRDVLPLDLGPLNVDRVTVGGRNASFAHRDNRLSITFEESYAEGDTVTVIVSYRGEPVDGLFIQPNKFGDRSVFADNWPNRARHWFPGVDHPYDKATVEFIVTAPAAFDVVANGRMVETTAVSPQRKRTHWKTEAPIPTYCRVVGAARFSIVRAGSWRGIPVSYYLFPGDRDAGTNDFARSTDMLAFYTGLFGPYPYAKLALVQSSTRFGGMENASARPATAAQIQGSQFRTPKASRDVGSVRTRSPAASGLTFLAASSTRSFSPGERDKSGGSRNEGETGRPDSGTADSPMEPAARPALGPRTPLESRVDTASLPPAMTVGPRPVPSPPAAAMAILTAPRGFPVSGGRVRHPALRRGARGHETARFFSRSVM